MIQQVSFEVPAEIMAGLASGKYVQYGGVVRDAAGHIVKHLKPVDVQDGANKALQIAVQAAQLAKQNKKLAIGALAVAGVAAAGGTAYAGITRFRHRKEEKMRRTLIDSFSVAFSEYLGALGKGELTIEKIDELERSIDALSAEENGFTVEIEGDQFKKLVKSVRDYTERLSRANGGKGPNPILKLFEQKPSDLDGLRDCLATQRGILSQAA